MIRKQNSHVSFSWPLIVGLVAVSCTLHLLPLVNRTWRATGDEPHYLLAAHSLAVDYDLDLANNYAQMDYINFYLSQDIVPQIRRNAGGAQLLSHYPALPIIIAPAYALAGRFGVLLFQVLLGSLLAAVTYKLTCHICPSVPAALLATAVVILSPPLLMYHYLVYPELFAALLTTTVLYCIVAYDRPTPTTASLVLVILPLLPWLNRRFVPLALLLAVLILWSWRTRANTAGHSGRLGGLAGLLLTMASIGLLIWFNSQFLAPERIDIIAPASFTGLGLRLIRGIGWLMDQQRGLFIFAPIYLLAFWGLPLLLRQSRQAHNRHWLVLLPFLISLAAVSAAGGFWVAWEIGPRFLLVGLPGLAPLLALAWQRYYHSKIWLAWAILLLIVTILNSSFILRNPELPYKSSLPLYYGELLSLPLVELLPDMAGYARLVPSAATGSQPQNPDRAAEEGEGLDQSEHEARILLVASPLSQLGALFSQPAAQNVLFIPAGRPQTIIQAQSLPDLPFGHYRVTWPLSTGTAADSATELIQLSIKNLGGGQLLRHTVTYDAGRQQVVQLSFRNTNPDRWRSPMVVNASTTGQADIWAGELLLTPHPFYALFLPWFGLLLVAIPAFVAAGKDMKVAGRNEPIIHLSPRHWRGSAVLPLRMVALTCLCLLPVIALGRLWTGVNRSQLTYDAGALSHFVGRAIVDPAANDGQAWLVDPALDPPQRAIYGPFDFYDAGRYHVVFRLKLPHPEVPVDGQIAALDTDAMTVAAIAVPDDLPGAMPEQEIARLHVRATTNFDQLLSQPIRAAHFTRPDLYHDMVLTVSNPRRQALSFEVEYLGLSPLIIDQVSITKIGSN